MLIKLTYSLASLLIAAVLIASIQKFRLNELHEREILYNKKTAETVFVALESFNKSKGRYPNDLGELVPLYLRALPVAAGKGNLFQYGASVDGRFYKIAFWGGSEGRKMFEWSSDSNYWACDSGEF